MENLQEARRDATCCPESGYIRRCIGKPWKDRSHQRDLGRGEQDENGMTPCGPQVVTLLGPSARRRGCVLGQGLGTGRQAGRQGFVLKIQQATPENDVVLGDIKMRRRKSGLHFRNSTAEIRWRKAWTRGGKEKTIASQKVGVPEPLNSGSGQKTERRRWITRITEMMFT